MSDKSPFSLNVGGGWSTSGAADTHALKDAPEEEHADPVAGASSPAVTPVGEQGESGCVPFLHLLWTALAPLEMEQPHGFVPQAPRHLKRGSADASVLGES